MIPLLQEKVTLTCTSPITNHCGTLFLVADNPTTICSRYVSTLSHPSSVHTLTISTRALPVRVIQGRSMTTTARRQLRVPASVVYTLSTSASVNQSITSFNPRFSPSRRNRFSAMDSHSTHLPLLQGIWKELVDEPDGLIDHPNKSIVEPCRSDKPVTQRRLSVCIFKFAIQRVPLCLSRLKLSTGFKVHPHRLTLPISALPNRVSDAGPMQHAAHAF